LRVHLEVPPGPCYHLSHPRTTWSRFIGSGAIAEIGTVRIQYHKILSDGRSVRYDRDPQGDLIHLSVIITEDEGRRARAKRSA